MAEGARRILQEIGDVPGKALTLNSLGFLATRAGKPALAQQYYDRSVRLNRLAGNRVGEGRALNSIAWLACTTGNFHKAVEYGHLALEAMANDDAVNFRAVTWDTIGVAYHHLGQLDRAADCFRTSIRYHERSGDMFHKSEAHDHFGAALLDKGDRDGARTQWQQAEQLLTELQHSHLAEIRQRLADLDHRSDPATEVELRDAV
jgi:tetratricopeptide (TPR) repeat protein